MDMDKFYTSLREHLAELKKPKLTQEAVNGINSLLQIAEDYVPTMTRQELAYNLATAYHETGATMQPIKERGNKSYFDKYEPNTKLGKALGNTKAGDGYRYRGEGHVQNSGRRNAAFSTKRLNELYPKLGVNFVAFPEQRGEFLHSALCLFIGNKEGWWTGKALNDYIDTLDETTAEDLKEFINARRVVNGTDKNVVIGDLAMAFNLALKYAGYGVRTSVHIPTDPVQAKDPPKAVSLPWWKVLLNAIMGK